MDFQLTVNLDNAAFEENPDELREILERLAAGIVGPITRTETGELRDYNGNTVGRWSVSDETAPAAVHLAEMRDLAGRLSAIGAADYAGGAANKAADLAPLALELAELVNHYEPGA